MKISVKWTLAILLGSLLYPASSRAASVSFTRLNGIGRLHGINRAGQAAGHSLGDEGSEGFIYQNGNLTPVKIQNSAGVQVFGIENNGRAVGQYYEYDPVTKAVTRTRGFLHFRGDITNIDFPGATSTSCQGINDPQQVVGYYRQATNGANHGFVFDGRHYTQLPEIPGATESYATAINNPGDIVGYYTAPPDSDGESHKHGFLYDKQGHLTTIEANIPGVTVVDTFPHGINSAGVIVGAYIDSDGNTHGFVDINGVFLSVDAPGTPAAVGTLVQGINDNGQLTALGTTALLGTILP